MNFYSNPGSNGGSAYRLANRRAAFRASALSVELGSVVDNATQNNA